MLKAILFDLDDTLFDHKFSPLKGLRALQDKYPKLNAVSLEDLQREHERLLRADYVCKSWSSDVLPAVRVRCKDCLAESLPAEMPKSSDCKRNNLNSGR